MSFVPPPNPVPFLTRAQLWLCGRWGEKALAILHDGKHHARVELPPALFDLLAILILAATKPTSPGESWVPSGFVTPEELCRELTNRWGGDPHQPLYTKKYVNRMIYRLERNSPERCSQRVTVAGNGSTGSLRAGHLAIASRHPRPTSNWPSWTALGEQKS